MENSHDLQKLNNILRTLNKLPRKIVSVHGRTNVPEFVLYDFCNEACFNFKKAAYFVNNPDFDCFKGIAGISRDECKACTEIADIWKEPEQFRTIMEKSTFNNKVRGIYQCSVSQVENKEAELIKQVAQDLEFENPDCYCWLSKHGNTGYLVFEPTAECTSQIKEYLADGVHLLSFCPIT